MFESCPVQFAEIYFYCPPLVAGFVVRNRLSCF